MNGNLYLKIQSLFLTSYHVKSSIISVVTRSFTSIISLLSYFILIDLLKNQIEELEFFSLGVVILTSVVLLLPFQGFILVRLKDFFLSEYLTDDLSSVNVAYRKLDLNSLIRNVFPDMVAITGSASGKLAILDDRQKNFMIYKYSRNRQQRIKIQDSMDFNSLLINMLREKKKAISIGETVTNYDVNAEFIALGVNYIIPFLFREKLFGFLATTNMPIQEDVTNLNILASKSALVIHNYILSSTVVEHQKYRKEFAFADKIQDLMMITKIPDMENVQINLSNKDPSLIVEFFLVNGSWHFVCIGITLNHKGAGLVLSYILGVIYSRYKSKSFTGVTSIFNIVKSTLIDISYRDEYCILVGAIGQEDGSIEIIYSGNGIKLYDRNENCNIKELRKTKFIIEDNILIAKIKECTILEFRKKETFNHPKKHK